MKEKVSKLERSIGEMETRMEHINEELVNASTTGDGDLIATRSREWSDLSSRLKRQYQALFESTEEVEKLEEKWNGKL